MKTPRLPGDEIAAGNYRSLARALTLVENGLEGSGALLEGLQPSETPVVGITGPPGAGKSSLVNAIASALSAQNKRVAILAIDPTSPFNFGSLLGDRIRMPALFNDPNVYIRSLATRGSLGGLSARTLEMADVLRAAGFDLILVETVGVGQSEVEIAGLADRTLVVLVPEAGDDVQHIKSGIMEIADAFALNKADREGAGVFYNNLKKLVHHKEPVIPVFQTVATTRQGVPELLEWILGAGEASAKRKTHLLADRAWRLIASRRMAGVTREVLEKQIAVAMMDGNFNLYQFINRFERERV